MSRRRAWMVVAAILAACGPAMPGVPDGGPDAGAGLPDGGDPYADRVVRFEPGPGAGFGQDRMPGVVLGPPRGAGASAGSLDVVSLGRSGVIELELVDVIAVDGPGVDFLVFENGFSGFIELAEVAVSEDGVVYRSFPCDGGAGCAGATVVYANPDQGISATDPAVAGGDGFDLSLVGLDTARFIRVTDTGGNAFYGPPGGGFDLDAVAVVNGRHP